MVELYRLGFGTER